MQAKQTETFYTKEYLGAVILPSAVQTLRGFGVTILIQKSKIVAI